MLKLNLTCKTYVPNECQGLICFKQQIPSRKYLFLPSRSLTPLMLTCLSKVQYSWCFLDALIKMKYKHHLHHKALPLGEPSTPYLGKGMQCHLFNATVVRDHKQYQTIWRKYSYAPTYLYSACLSWPGKREQVSRVWISKSSRTNNSLTHTPAPPQLPQHEAMATLHSTKTTS